jgi:hypothetical protein
MEYFLGSLITFAIVIVLTKTFQNKDEPDPFNTIQYSQSYIHELISPLIYPDEINRLLSPLVSQAKKHYDKTNIRILFMDEKAYWITNNKFYNADTEDGEVLKETTKEVDIMGMDEVELEKMTFIVEKLTEGLHNDSGDSGNKKF